MSKKFSIPSDAESVIMIPLGGCGNIGKNLTLYCYKKTWIIIDCGISFSDGRFTPGVDLIVPDLTFIEQNKIKISAIIITHAHEDHIGAVPHFIKNLKCPVYGTKFALEFLKLKLRDFTNVDQVVMKEIGNAELKIESFVLQPIFLTHSIPEMHGILIKAGENKIFHTGDWKIDNSPVVGAKIDIAKINEMVGNGITAIACDSTNVLSEGRSKSEGELEESLYKIIKTQKGMVFVGTFASNVARIKTLCNIAKKTGRAVGLSGLSLSRITSIAKKCGYLDSESFLDGKEAMLLPKKDVLMICTGCQGEMLATMSKLANNSHPVLKFHSNDTVIFSSKIIPGNEKKIGEVMNRFADANINVITEKEQFVHVSGHPYRDEIREIYSIFKPKFSIPIHGESVHLRSHCKLVNEEKLAEKSIFTRDGDVLIINGSEIKKAGKVVSGYLCIDGNLLLSPDSQAMKERRKIRDSGIVNVSIIFDKKLKMQDFIMKIIGLLSESKEIASEVLKIENNIKKIINANIANLVKKSGKSNNNDDKIIPFISSAIAKEIEKKFNKHPLVSIIIHNI